MKTVVGLVCASLLVVGCPMKDSNPVSPDQPSSQSDAITTGVLVEIASQTIGASGGVIRAVKPGDPLDGLQLTVKANSFSQVQSFKISSAPVLGHRLGKYFNPITPVIEISYGGGYSDLPMQMKIPIKLSAGKFAMGYLYDKKTGAIEGIPIEHLESGHILLSSRQFFSSGTLGKISGPLGSGPAFDVVISAVDDSVLDAQNIIDSGFKPGVDDWEFPNYGSYIAPAGNCAGQTTAAMYYFLIKKKGGVSPLNHRYDQIDYPAQPGVLWEDNPKAYRLVSTVQNDSKWESLAPDIQYQTGRDQVIWKTFALSMLSTGQPQFVNVFQSALPYGGHAMIVYKIDYPRGLMYVADPNYPGNRDPKTGNPTVRTIEFNNINTFNPYHSGPNAKKPGSAYDLIFFIGKTAYVDFSLMEKRWTQFEAGTIGDDVFPPFTILVDSITGPELKDGFVYTGNPIVLMCRSMACQRFLGKTDHLQTMVVFDQTGKVLAVTDSMNRGLANVKLVDGVNKLGIYVGGARDSSMDYYIDFKWINVYSLAFSVDPRSLVADLNKEYTFTANVTGSGAIALKYVWNFGDGSAELTQLGSSSAKHTFTAEGAFSVAVKLYNNTTGQLLAIASSSVTVPSNFVKEVTGTQYSEIYLLASFKAENGVMIGGQGINSRFEVSPPQVVWNGVSFTSNYSYKVPPITETDTMTVTGTMSGSISADGRVLTVMTATEQGSHRDTPETYRYTISLRNVPYYQKSAVGPWTSYYYYVNGPNCQNYVSSASLTAKLSLGGSYQTLNSASVVYGPSSSLEVGFVRKQ